MHVSPPGDSSPYRKWKLVDAAAARTTTQPQPTGLFLVPRFLGCLLFLNLANHPPPAAQKLKLINHFYDLFHTHTHTISPHLLLIRVLGLPSFQSFQLHPRSIHTNCAFAIISHTPPSSRALQGDHELCQAKARLYQTGFPACVKQFTPGAERYGDVLDPCTVN